METWDNLQVIVKTVRNQCLGVLTLKEQLELILVSTMANNENEHLKKSN